MSGTLWEKPKAGGQGGEEDLVVLVEREPESFLRGAVLAWHRGAGLALAEEAPPEGLFGRRRVAEAEVSEEALQGELPAELREFYRRCRRSAALEQRLFFALRHGEAGVVRVAEEALRDIRRYGFRYVLNKVSPAGRALASRSRQVRMELFRLKGLIRLVPVRVGEGEVLVGRAETPHHIADLLVEHFRERFAQYRIVLLVGERAYISGEPGQVLTDAAEPYRRALAQDDFERFWLAYYGSQSIPLRANPRLRQQRLPKRYWSWVREATLFTRRGS